MIAAIAPVDWLHIPDGGSYPPGVPEGNWQQRWAGTYLARILDIHPTGTGFTAAYCLDSIAAAAYSDDGGGNPPRQPPTTAPPQPSRAPRYDVFDGWTITDAWGHHHAIPAIPPPPIPAPPGHRPTHTTLHSTPTEQSR